MPSMYTSKVSVPSFKAFRIPVTPNDEGGILTVEISSNSALLLAFCQKNEVIASDVDDILINYEGPSVRLGELDESPWLRLCNALDLELLEKTIRLCLDILSLSLRMNISLRDCFYSGVHCGGESFHELDANSIINALSEASRYVKTPKVVKDKAHSASSGSNTVAKPHAKCFFCQATTKRYRATSIAIHPYVSSDYKGADICMCMRCISTWKTYRTNAQKAGELVLPGETNEELCALCSAIPDTLILCSSCPRSFCEVCLSIVIGQSEFKKMKSQEDWRCMECCVTKKKNDQQQIVSSPTMEATTPQKPLKVLLKNKLKKSPVAAATPVLPENLTPVRGRKRKCEVATGGDAAELPPVDKEHDEYFYFGQYVNLVNASYNAFGCTNENSKVSSIDALPKQSEDFCMLCKDGGELVECDYVHKIFSYTFINPITSHTEESSTAGVVSAHTVKQCFRKVKCPKVYHCYCLGYDVNADNWHCPRHFCSLCTEHDPYYTCELCCLSFCKTCAISRNDRFGGKKLVELALVSEYCGKDAKPKAPNKERMKIICNGCIDMCGKCIQKNEISAPCIPPLLDTSRDIMALDDGATSSRSSLPRVVEISPWSQAKRLKVESSNSSAFSPPTDLIEHFPSVMEQGIWSHEDSKYFEEYLRAYTPSADGVSCIGEILNDSAFRERLSQYDSKKIRQRFYVLVKALNRGELKSRPRNVKNPGARLSPARIVTQRDGVFAEVKNYQEPKEIQVISSSSTGTIGGSTDSPCSESADGEAIIIGLEEDMFDVI